MSKTKAKNESKNSKIKISEKEVTERDLAETKAEQSKDENSELTKEPTDSMKSKSVTKTDMGLLDVDDFILEHKLPAWQGAALCRNEAWAPGKKVSKNEFTKALERLNNRPLGG